MQLTVVARALGAPGRPGNSLLNYAGPPPDNFGRDGDYCIDTVHEVLLGPKADGTWPSSGISLAPGQPPWAAPATAIGAITSTTAEHVANSRALAAAALQPNDVVEATILLYIPPDATNDEKFVRFCVGEDSANSLLEIFDAGVVGTVIVQAQLCIKAAAPHPLHSMFTLNNALWDAQRDAVVVDVADALNLETRIWVANADDQIVVDAIYLSLNRTGL